MRLRIIPTHTYNGTPVRVTGTPFRVHHGYPPGVLWVAAEYPDGKMRPCNADRLVEIPPGEVKVLPVKRRRRRWWRR